jgi:CRISPR/Cas system Type II protein with McrA/HNH and RuvC-like nuclease domain
MAKTHKTLIKLYNRDGGKCSYCNRQTRMTTSGFNCNDEDYASIDHYVAKAAGGSDSMNNKVLACRGCNSNKGMLDRTEFELFQMLRPKSERIDWVWEELFEEEYDPSPDGEFIRLIRRIYSGKPSKSKRITWLWEKILD